MTTNISKAQVFYMRKPESNLPPGVCRVLSEPKNLTETDHEFRIRVMDLAKEYLVVGAEYDEISIRFM